MEAKTRDTLIVAVIIVAIIGFFALGMNITPTKTDPIKLVPAGTQQAYGPGGYPGYTMPNINTGVQGNNGTIYGQPPTNTNDVAIAALYGLSDIISGNDDDDDYDYTNYDGGYEG